jgi:heme a synthase
MVGTRGRTTASREAITEPTTGFRRLVGIALAATFALVIVGGVVRLSDSGLGCGPAGSGFHGWPMCRGDLVPGLELNAIVEYAHRVLAAAVGVLLIALAVVAWRRFRGSHRGIVRATLAAVALVILQGLLGAATVELNLDALLVAAHLGLAMLLLGLLLYVRRAAGADAASFAAGTSVRDPGPGTRTDEPASGTAGSAAAAGLALRRLGAAACVAVLLTIMAGGYMAGTEKHGRTDRVAGAGAHHACGTDFPACNGSFMPFGQSALADVHLTHRAFMYVAVVLVLTLVAWTLRRPPDRRAARYAAALGGVLVLQALLGAVNVWVPEEYELLVLAHLTAGTLLWMAVVARTLALRPAPESALDPAADAAEERGPRRGGEPVTA